MDFYFLIPIVIGFMVGWVIGGGIAYLLTHPGPFNWRALIWAGLYFNWLDAREPPKEDWMLK